MPGSHLSVWAMPWKLYKEEGTTSISSALLDTDLPCLVSNDGKVNGHLQKWATFQQPHILIRELQATLMRK